MAVQVVAGDTLLTPCKDTTKARTKQQATNWFSSREHMTPSTTAVQALTNAWSAFEQAETRWGGYEAFKQTMDTRVYEEGAINV